MGVKGRIHSVETFGTIDGPGIRYIVFTQGCPLRCKFCHNRTAWDPNEGQGDDSEDLLTDIRKYYDFYHNSGGGVTVSGGEPLLQPDFTEAIFKGVKAMGLNTALDTSGFVDLPTVEKVLDVTDLVLMDVKQIGSSEHQELTGVPNEKILEFIQRLSQRKIKMWIRHVIIPGITAMPERVHMLGAYLLTVESIERIELLGYHKMGTQKWEQEGCQDPLAETPAASSEMVDEAKNILRQMGLKNVY